MSVCVCVYVYVCLCMCVCVLSMLNVSYDREDFSIEWTTFVVSTPPQPTHGCHASSKLNGGPIQVENFEEKLRVRNKKNEHKNINEMITCETGAIHQ